MFDVSGHKPARRCPLCRAAAVWDHPIPHNEECAIGRQETFAALQVLRPKGNKAKHLGFDSDGWTLCGTSCDGWQILDVDEEASCRDCLRERARIDLAALWLEMSESAIDLYIAADKVLQKARDAWPQIVSGS